MPIQPEETSAVGAIFKINLVRGRFFSTIFPIITEISLLIGQDYRLNNPGRCAEPKLFLHTQVVPLAVNVTSGFEVVVDRSARRLGVTPALIPAGAAGLAPLSVLVLAYRSRAKRRT